MENKKAQQKKKKSPIGKVVLVVVLLSMLSEFAEGLGDGGGLHRLWFRLRMLMRPVNSWLFRMGIDPPWCEWLPWIALVLALVLLIALIASAAKKSKAAASDRPPVPGKPRPDPRTASFQAPEAHCVSCEISGEDHFARDRAQRIAQLDEWLKNGLIERDEYRLLKSRYMQE